MKRDAIIETAFALAWVSGTARITGQGRPAVTTDTKVHARRLAKPASVCARRAANICRLQVDLGNNLIDARTRGYDPNLSRAIVGKDAPLGRQIERSLTIVITPILSGLHHCYARI
jgi:hypothetical protein